MEQAGEFMESNYLADFVRTVMLISDEIERYGDTADIPYLSGLKMGYRTALMNLRHGIKAVMDLQEAYAREKVQSKIAKNTANHAKNFLADIFGDADVSEINESDKERLKVFVGKMVSEWE